MKAAALIKYLKTFPKDAEVVEATYNFDGKSGLITLTDIEACCNTEHQKEIGEVWLCQEIITRRNA